MRLLLTLLALTISAAALAENSSLSLQLPQGSQSYQSDKFRAGDLDCSNAIGGATNLEFGVTGIVDNYESMFGDSNPEGINSTRDVGVYARIIIPLDAPPERINCNSLYQLELRKKRLEVLRLQEELEQLRKLNRGQGSGFEN